MIFTKLLLNKEINNAGNRRQEFFEIMTLFLVLTSRF